MLSTPSTSTKPRERSLRRQAAQQGYQLAKFRGRNVNDHRFGTFMVIDSCTASIAWADFGTGQGYGLDLDDVAEYLARPVG